jgi:hypothetical protein
MNQSLILIAEMSDADGVQICVKTLVEHGLGQTKHIFIRSIRTISKRDKTPPISTATMGDNKAVSAAQILHYVRDSIWFPRF